MSEKRESTFDEAVLNDLSVAELEVVRDRATELIAEKAVAEKAALRGDIENLLDEHGLKLFDVFDELAPKRRGRRPGRADHGDSVNDHDIAPK